MPHYDHSRSGSDQVEILDLDAEVLAQYLAAITDWLPIEAPPRRMVDLGAGTGAGTFALLERFPQARVTAVDSSETHLERLREKSRRRGVADQVSTVLADLDDPVWPDLGIPDLVWASASMHHMAEPHQALSTVYKSLAPGGIFAVIELDGFPRFLPDNAPVERPGLEERCHALSEQYHRDHVPHRGADWGPKLVEAGFTLENEQAFPVEVTIADDPAVGNYALNGLRRLRDRVYESLSIEDRAELDRLLDDNSSQFLLRRGDLAVRTERTVWAGRK